MRRSYLVILAHHSENSWYIGYHAHVTAAMHTCMCNKGHSLKPSFITPQHTYVRSLLAHFHKQVPFDSTHTSF